LALFYQCSHCYRYYPSSEFFDRLKDHVVSEESGIMGGREPTPHTSVCECGKPFRVNKWHIKDVVPYKCSYYLVSTVHLELNYGNDDSPLWYETRVFPCNKFGHILYSTSLNYFKKHTTQMTAEEKHKSVMQSIIDGTFF